MSPVTAPEVTAAPPGERALFREARRRRRRRWLAGITVVLAASAAAASALAATGWPHRAPGPGERRSPAAGTTATAGTVASVAWLDDMGLHVGRVHADGGVTQRVVAHVTAGALPLLQAGGRIYWVNPAGGYVPALVQYLALDTGRTGTAGPGQTVFLSAGGRYLFMSRPATSLTEMAVAGGASRQLTLPPGWYLPGGDGLGDLVSGAGLATANGIVVQSQQSPGRIAPVLALWDPVRGTVKVLGRGRPIDAYTPPGARYSLLAWLSGGHCPPPGSCLLKITDTATMTGVTVRSPLPGGFALGGAFSPDGTRLAVFLNDRASSGTVGRLALAGSGTGAIRVARMPGLALGMDVAWARWLPGGSYLLAGAGTPGGYLVDAARPSARPLRLAPGSDRKGSQDVNNSVVVIPPRR